mmetsp:Transcript_325/g.702  ORF Transcript_325/g.702 Transcript_325/m.702 type:complete len:128 (-) Transcript_325:821-1204(-)
MVPLQPTTLTHPLMAPLPQTTHLALALICPISLSYQPTPSPPFLLSNYTHKATKLSDLAMNYHRCLMYPNPELPTCEIPKGFLSTLPGLAYGLINNYLAETPTISYIQGMFLKTSAAHINFPCSYYP